MLVGGGGGRYNKDTDNQNRFTFQSELQCGFVFITQHHNHHPPCCCCFLLYTSESTFNTLSIYRPHFTFHCPVCLSVSATRYFFHSIVGRPFEQQQEENLIPSPFNGTHSDKIPLEFNPSPRWTPVEFMSGQGDSISFVCGDGILLKGI